MRQLLLWTALGAVPVVVAGLPPARFDIQAAPAQVMPPECLLYAEVPGLPELCEQGLDHPLVGVVMASPLGAVVREATGGLPLPFALGMANGYLGRPVLPCLQGLTRDGLAVGVLQGEGDTPVACVIARGDAELWDEILALAMDKVAEAQDLPKKRVVAAHRDIRGMDVWLLGELGAMALEDGVFVAATEEATLRQMLDLGAVGGGLDEVEGFDPPSGSASFASAWLDVPGLTATFPAITEGPELPALLGEDLAPMLEADAAQLELDLEDGVVGLSLTARGAQLAGVPPLEASRSGDELALLLDETTEALVSEAVERGGEEAAVRDALKQLRRFVRRFEQASLGVSQPAAETLRLAIRVVL